MATIRIPESAEPLLPFCRTSGSNGPHIWDTYADLIAFLAALGYAHDVMPPEKPRPLKTANPIDLSTFRSRGLYPQLLMLAIADRRDWLVSKSPDEIAAITERYTDSGAKYIHHEAEVGSTDVLAGKILEILQEGRVPASSKTPTI